ncbi:MAG: undecaprenyldiphospho-muramoylpentapeptide beta-N-acetylglucosaminyltransferase [Candidatus Aminicenantes bacterium]|jgi:UDP-N-acetylglucosamine--N-acetylmuramyl-(pentapeptide) pyrophosphoryl-undecaprenol N-acetylglucosamine transferase
MKQIRLIFSGGGTAGHLYPGLVVSEKLREREPEIQIAFVGGSRSLERDIMDRYGLRFIPLKIEGLKGMGIKTIKSLLLLPFAFLKSFILVKRIQPHLVIGLGGYSSGPIVLLSSWLKIPTLILEQNVYPGFTNRVLIPWVRKAVVAFESSLSYFKGKGLYLGNPARVEFYTLRSKPRNSHLSLLIFGGSQGSHFLNTQIVNTLPLLKSKKDKLRIFHQTGKKDYEWVRRSYNQNGFQDVELAPYFYDIHRYFEKADLVISRAGATTLAELIASQKAALLVPFARAADNHQFLNAQELAKIGGAEVLQEEEVSPECFKEKISLFLDEKHRLDRMEKNIAALKKENIAEHISKLCWNLIENSRKEKNP